MRTMIGPSQFRTTGGRAPAAATTGTEFAGGLERSRTGAYDRARTLENRAHPQTIGAHP